MPMETTARGDKYYIARETPLYNRRRCCFPWPICLAVPLAVVIIFAITSTVLAPNDRLVLADNTTQPMIDGNWTDVNYDETLIASVRWSHVDAPPGPNAEVVSLASGTYTIVVGIHPEVTPSLFGLADPSPAPCGTCPCDSAPCNATSDCCDPMQGWTLGNSSLCVGGSCLACLAINDTCFDDNQCRCGGLYNASCLPHNGGVCTVDYPDAPCGFCPCYDFPCTNNSDCCDPLNFGYGNASYCNGFVGSCQVCVQPGGICSFDADCNCFDIQYQCLPNLTSSQFQCTFVPSLAPTSAPTAAIPCTNVSQCPSTHWCDIGTGLCERCDELVTCCNTTDQCNSDEYCSPQLGICMPCVGDGGDCTADPLSACNCTPDDHLGCIGGVCTLCGFLVIGDSCFNDLECSCDNSTLCLPDPSQNNDTFCRVPCNTSSDCPNDTFYCSPTFQYCVPCAGYLGDCLLDPLYQCNCSSVNNLTSPLFCDFDNTGLCTIPCTNLTQCPGGDSYCNPYDLNCHPCYDSQCCNTTGDCSPDQYCSPTFGVCIPCANFSQDCSLDPTSECNCTPGSNLYCNPDLLVCDIITEAPTQAPTNAPTQAPTKAPTQAPTNAPTNAPTSTPTNAPTNAPTSTPTSAPTPAPTKAPTAAPTTAPTAAPTAEPVCPPSPIINARLVRQRNPNPAFVPIAGPFVPVLSGGMYVFSVNVATLAGDVIKVQWYSPDCPLMALTPIPFNLATLAVPGKGIQNTSAYLTATLI